MLLFVESKEAEINVVLEVAFLITFLLLFIDFVFRDFQFVFLIDLCVLATLSLKNLKMTSIMKFPVKQAPHERVKLKRRLKCPRAT